MLQRLNSATLPSVLYGDVNQIHANRHRTKSAFQECKTGLKSIWDTIRNFSFECKCRKCRNSHKNTYFPRSSMVQGQSRPNVPQPILLSIVQLPSYSAVPILEKTYATTDKSPVQSIPLLYTHWSSANSTSILDNTGSITDKRSDQQIALLITHPHSFFAATTSDDTNHSADKLNYFQMLNSLLTRSQARSNETIRFPASVFENIHANKSKLKDNINTIKQPNQIQDQSIQKNIMDYNSTIFSGAPALPIVFQKNKTTLDSFSYHLLDHPQFESIETERSSKVPGIPWSNYSQPSSSTDLALLKCSPTSTSRFNLTEQLKAIREIWPNYSYPFSSPITPSPSFSFFCDKDSTNIKRGPACMQSRSQKVSQASPSSPSGSEYMYITPPGSPLGFKHSDMGPESFDSAEWLAKKLFCHPGSPPPLFWSSLTFPKKQPIGALKQERSLLSRMLQQLDAPPPPPPPAPAFVYCVPSSSKMIIPNRLSESLERYLVWENKVNRNRSGLIKKATPKEDITDLTITNPNMFITFW